MSLWDIKVETKRQKCRKSRNGRNKKQTLLKLTTFHAWRILVVKDDVYLKTNVMRRNRKKSYFIQPNLLNLHWKGFGWIRSKSGFADGTTFSSYCRVLLWCVVLFWPSQLGAVDSEARFPQSRCRLSDKQPRNPKRDGARPRSASHPIDSSHAHTRMPPGFHLNANRLSCYIMAGAAERLHKLRLGRPSGRGRRAIAATDMEPMPRNSMQQCREEQILVTMMNPRPSASPVWRALQQRTTPPRACRWTETNIFFFAKVSSRNFFLRKASNLQAPQRLLRVPINISQTLDSDVGWNAQWENQ